MVRTCQDQDVSELAWLIRQVARLQDRWIKIASAFPDCTGASNRRGINGTDWCPIDRPTYRHAARRIGRRHF